MENWEGRLRSVLEGVCCLFGCGDVYCVSVDGASKELVDAAGVHCPQGIELWGEELLLLLEDVGWGLAWGRLGVVCGRSVFWGYIPGHLSCRSIR